MIGMTITNTDIDLLCIGANLRPAINQAIEFSLSLLLQQLDL